MRADFRLRELHAGRWLLEVKRPQPGLPASDRWAWLTTGATRSEAVNAACRAGLIGAGRAAAILAAPKD